MAVLGLTTSCGPRVVAARVLVIGDSLTVGAETAGLGDQHGSTWTIDAETGRGTNAGVTAARGHDLTRYDLVIVALGTNDYLDDKTTYATRIDAMMAVLGDRHRVIWVDVDAHAARLGPAAYGVNPAIAAATRRHPNLTAADWDGFLAGRDSSGLRAGDGVHYTAAGYRLRADWTEAMVVPAAR